MPKYQEVRERGGGTDFRFFRHVDDEDEEGMSLARRPPSPSCQEMLLFFMFWTVGERQELSRAVSTGCLPPMAVCSERLLDTPELTPLVEWCPLALEMQEKPD